MRPYAVAVEQRVACERGWLRGHRCCAGHPGDAPAARSIRAAARALGEADQIVVELLLRGTCERGRRSDEQQADDDCGCKDPSHRSCPPMRTAWITYARGHTRRRDLFSPHARPTHSKAY